MAMYLFNGNRDLGERWRNAFWLLAGLVLSGALLFAANWEADRRGRLQMDNFRGDVVNLVRISETAIDEKFHDFDNILLSLRSAYVSHPKFFPEYLRMLRKGPMSDPSILVVLVDSDGYLAFTDVANMNSHTYLGDRKYFRYFADGGKDSFYIDEPIMGRVTKRHTLPLARPIYDNQGSFLGVVVLSVPQEALAKLWPKQQLSGNTTINLITHDGVLLSSSRGFIEARGVKIQPELLAPMNKEVEGVFTNRTRSDEGERVIAFRQIRLGATPLIVYVDSSPKQVSNDISRLRTLLMLSAGTISLIIMILIAVYLKKQKISLRLIDTLRRNREQEYETLTQTPLNGFYISDLSGRILETNDAYCAMLGYSKEETLCLSLSDIEAAETPKQIADHILSIVEDNHDRFQTQHRRKDGSVIDVEVSAQYVDKSGGQFFVFIRDITRRKQAEKQLREKDEFILAVLDHLPIGIAVNSIDPTVNFQYMNDNFPKFYRTTREALTAPDNFWDAVYEDKDFRDRIREKVLADCASGDPERMVWEDVPITRTGEETTFITARNTPLQDKQLMISTVWDVTERKRSEAERERLLFAIEQAGEMIVITDPQGIIQFVNPAFERTTGYTREEIVGQSFRILKSGQQDDAFYRTLWDTISGGNIYQGRMVNKRKDGTFFTEEATISPVLDNSRRIVNYVAIKRDVTEHLKLEAQFLQAQKMESVGRLAGGVAHDYNNMLSVIIGYAQMAMLKFEPQGKLHFYLQEILKAANRSAAITQQLLTHARKQTINPVMLDLNETVEPMTNMLRQLIGEDIDLLWKPGQVRWLVKMDPSQLDQMLVNLCINARDAMHNLGGKITIETGHVTFDEGYCTKHPGFRPGNFILLAVSDDGSGMDKDTLNKIFEPFFTTKEESLGTGLGLATVYGIVKQNNGFINVYSEPGGGTTFKLYLAGHVGATAKTIDARATTLISGHGETILLVDDELQIMELGGKMLEELGYQVLTANSPNDAMQLAEENKSRINLLITDVVMQGMNGRDLADHLRRIYPELKVLFMSGYTANVIAHRCVLDGEVNFIPKPFSIEALATKVSTVLGNS